MVFTTIQATVIIMHLAYSIDNSIYAYSHETETGGVCHVLLV